MSKQIPLGLYNPQQHTFENYIGNSNQHVINTLQHKTTEHPFIYIYGQPSLGSSHLLHACCNNTTNKNIIYLDLKQLPNNPAIFEGLSDLSLCCIDHIEYINCKAMEIGLFNLFNNIQAQKNRLVIAAKKPPNQLDIQLADLKSRLTSGLCLQLINPDDEDKKQILSNLAQRYGLELSRECSNYLLTHHGRNLRDLIKTLQTLDQAAWIEQRRLTIPFIKQCLAQQTQALY